jgi:prolycopene isomerase
MKTGFDAIVIGTGLGGSAAGALLQKAGFKTLILEKNERIGGSCSCYTKDGFKVDIGTHMFTRGNKGPIGVVQNMLGISNKIQFIQTRDLALAKGMGFNIVLPSSRYRLPYFFAKLFRQLRVPFRELPRVIKLFYDLATMPDEEIEMWNHKNVEEFIRRYTTHPQLFAYLGFLLGLYFVLPLWETSAGEAIWCYKRMFHDNSLSYPRGGAITVPGTFINAATSLGATLLTQAEVKKIIIDKGSVKGVELADGRAFESGLVISTTSLKDNVFRLVGEAYFPEKYVRKIKNIKGSYIAVQAKIALDKKLIKAGALVGGSSKYYKGGEIDINSFHVLYQDITKGYIPKIVPLYCPVPTNFDPELGPSGKQLLTVCSVAPTTDVELKDAPEKWIESMLEAMRDLIPGLDKHTLWIDRFTTKFVERWSGKLYGPAISTGQTPEQVGALRPPIRTPIRGLYFAGDCAGGRGIGTELATQSAIECFNTIINDLKYGFMEDVKPL